MKLILNASAVKKLIDIDPEGTVELSRTAAAQIANEITRLVTRERVTARIDDFFARDLTEGGSWNARVTLKYRKVLHATMEAMAADFIKNVTSGEINRQLRLQIDAIIAEQSAVIAANLQAHADQILRERFAAMFGEKSA